MKLRCKFVVALATFIAAHLGAETAVAPPKLAIISQQSGPAVGDLLFAKLSASGGIALIERDQFARIVKEFELSSFARKSNVRAGQLASADVLLFVETEKKLLHLRMVETHHGERVFDAVFDSAKPDFPAIIETTKAHLATLARKLRTPPDERLYVALAPIATFHQTHAFTEALATLSTLIGVRLSQDDRVIVVERDDLASVVAEKELNATAEDSLSTADGLVRGRVAEGNAAQLSLEFRVLHAHGSKAATFHVKVERTKLGEGAAMVAVKIGEALGLKSPPPANALAAEARHHYLSGLALLHAQLFEPALRSLETACLLDPQNEKYARSFLGGVARCIEERVGGNIEDGRAVSAKDYLFYLDRLRAAMAVARGHAPSASEPLARGRRVCSFLAVQNEHLNDGERALVAACRPELREFFERFCADAKDEKGKRLLGDYAPIFFEEPRAALEYFKRIAAAGGYPWSGLREHVYPRIGYWDRKLAWKLWSEFLDEVERDPSPEKQFSAIAARCFQDEVFPSAYSQGVRGKGRESAQRLFTWLAAREENLQWVLAHENWYIFLRIWHAMPSLPIGEQDRYFETVMLKVLAKDRGMEHNAFYYLQVRLGDSARGRQAKEDGTQIRKMLDAALATIKAGNPKLHDEVLAKLATEDWYATLTRRRIKSGTPEPDIPGGVLLYDSSRIKPATDTYDSMNGLADGGVLWIAHSKSKAIIVTRIEMKQNTSETCEFAVESSLQEAFEHLVLARSPQHLFVADKYRVLAIRVAEKAPYLNAGAVEIIGPKFGADETAGTFDREVRAFRDPHFRRITAVVPVRDELYIALDQRTHDNSNRYGAIYRWRSGVGDCELICASASLRPGPLNDCLPYSVIGGCASRDGSAIHFFLADVPRQPATFAEGQRRGAWNFTPASGKWEQLRAGRFGNFTRRPAFVSETIFDIPGESGNDRFNLETLKIERAIGDISGADAGHGWEAKSEEQSQVHYERLYRAGGSQRVRLFSLNAREFEIGSLIPTAQGLVVLLSGLQPGGNVPTTRGLAYLLPDER